MRLLYSSTSMAFTQSLRVVLDREDIGYFCSDADSSLAGIGGPAGGSPSRIYVLHEEDWDRAVEALQEILPHPKPADAATAARKPISTGAIIAASALAAALIAVLLSH